MDLRPRYDGEPILHTDGVTNPAAALVRQRRRLLTTLESLSDEQWAAPSRCEEWTTQGVVTHLITTDQFWNISFTSALAGSPTKFLENFDPVQTPAQLVRGHADLSARDVLDRYRSVVGELTATIEAVTPQQWATVRAEAPPGHLALVAAALHALWDAWIHERDIAIPLGLPLVEDDEELTLVLRYVAGLSPAFGVAGGHDAGGVLAVQATDPDVSLLVRAATSVVVTDGTEEAAPCLQGRAVDLIEGLSHRAPFASGLVGDDAWWLRGLADVFDVQP